MKKSDEKFTKIIKDLHIYMLDQTVQHTNKISKSKKLDSIEIWVEFHSELSRITNTFFNWLDQSIEHNEVCCLLPPPFLNYIRFYFDDPEFVKFCSKNYRLIWLTSTRDYDLNNLHKFNNLPPKKYR